MAARVAPEVSSTSGAPSARSRIASARILFRGIHDFGRAEAFRAGKPLGREVDGDHPRAACGGEHRRGKPDRALAEDGYRCASDIATETTEATPGGSCTAPDGGTRLKTEGRVQWDEAAGGHTH